MSTLQPQSPSTDFPTASTGPDFRSVASKQRGMLLCVLGYIILMCLYTAADPNMRPFLSSIGLVFSLAATVYVFMLATTLYGTSTGILMGIFSLIPILGLIILLVANSKANKLLKQNGFQIGLLGANMDQVRSN